jgi:hypothetical protein
MCIPHLSIVRTTTAAVSCAYRMDATMSLLKAVEGIKQGNKIGSDLEQCRMAITGESVLRRNSGLADSEMGVRTVCLSYFTGGLELPEGKLEATHKDTALVDPAAGRARHARMMRAYWKSHPRYRAYQKEYNRHYIRRPDRKIKERERSRRRYAHKAHTSTPESRAKEAARKRERSLKYYWKNKDKILQKTRREASQSQGRRSSVPSRPRARPKTWPRHVCKAQREH